MTAIQFKFEENIKGPNRGWIVHKVAAILKDEEIGYIISAYIPSTDFDRIYHSCLDYAVRIEGWCCILGREEEVNHWTPTNKQIQSLLVYIHIRESIIITDQNRNYYLYLIKKYAKERFHKHIKNFKERFYDNPQVENIFVDKYYRNKGIGKQLYCRMAYELDQRYGLSLRASELQSESAENCWRSFEKDGLTSKKGRWKILKPSALSLKDINRGNPHSYQEQYAV